MGDETKTDETKTDDKNETRERQLAGHRPRAMHNLGVDNPAGDKSATPAEDLPTVEGNQQTERVQIR